jgi:peptidoglycan/xylan/chitin deacetylase (PgdA/CDA1 family)
MTAPYSRGSVGNVFRRVALIAYVFLLRITGQLHRAKQRLRQTNAILVLMLHRVLDKDAARRTCSQSEIVLLRSTFERMVGYLASEFEIFDVGSGVAPFPLKAERPRVAVTFDDGWSDNYTVAFPAASAAGIRFSVFICPQLVGKNQPFWPERVVAGMRAKEPRVTAQKVSAVIERLKAMPASERDGYVTASRSGGDGVDATFDWSHALEMQAAGVTFGSHTSTHQMLTRIPPVEAQREIFDSRGAIRSRMSRNCEVFAYPNGDVSAKVRDLVKDAGYRLAFTTQPGFWTDATDPLQIPRMNVSEEKVTGLTGRFSRSMFDYSMIWKASRAV